MTANSGFARLKKAARAFVPSRFRSRRRSKASSAGAAPAWYEVEALMRPNPPGLRRAEWLVISDDPSGRCHTRFASRTAALRYARGLARARCDGYEIVDWRAVQMVPAGISEEELAALTRYSRSAARAWPGTRAEFPDPDAAVGVAIGRAFVRGFRAGKSAVPVPASQEDGTRHSDPEETPGHERVLSCPPVSRGSGETERGPDASAPRDSPDVGAQASPHAREGSADPAVAPPAGWTPEEVEIAARRYESALSDVVSVPERRELYQVLRSWESRGRDPVSVAASAEGFLLWYLTTADIPFIPPGAAPPTDPDPYGPIGEIALARLEELETAAGAEDRLLAVRGVVMELMTEAFSFLGLWKYYQESKRDAERGA